MIDTVLFACNLALLVPAVYTFLYGKVAVFTAAWFSVPLTLMGACFFSLELWGTAVIVWVTAGVWLATAVKMDK